MHHKRLIRPVFLLCSERSGSNLVARIFGSHDDFFAPSPAHLFRVFASFAPEQDLSRDIARMFDAKLGIWKLDSLPEDERLALMAKGGTTAGMIAALLNAEGSLQGKDRLFLKENSSHGFLDFMESVSDDPRYVHMIRDPRDMAVSWVAAPTLRGGVVRAARRWLADAEGSVRVAEGRTIVRLSYEGLVSRPEETLRQVCDGLEIGFSEAMLEHVGNSQGVAQDAGRTALWGNLSRGIMRDNFNKFAGKLSDDEIAFIEALCGKLMDRFGYERSRSAEAPPYGRHESFAALEAALEAQEPWEKPAYQALPEGERARLEHWSALRQELIDRHG